MVRRMNGNGARRTMVASLAALIAACSPSPGSTASVSTDDPAPAELGIFADVRGWMAYSDKSGIWAVDPSNPDADPVLLRPNEARSNDESMPIAWSSDGSKLLITRGDPSFRGPDDLVVLNCDGTETLLAHGGMDELFTGGSFTPDGSKVIYGVISWSTPEEDWRSGIYVVDADGGSPRLIYAAGRRPPPDSFQMALFLPTLSPDGSRIAFFEGMGDWANYLWVMNADGSDKHRIFGTEEAGHVSALQWSPDGTRLAFETVGVLYVVNVDGSGPPLANVTGRSPYWSPDGSRIAFLRERGILHTMAPDGSDVQSLGIHLGRGGSGPWNPLEE